jgi:hypothetical protein
MTDLADIEARLDALTIPLLVPLRSTKTLDGTAIGKAWFIFTSMLDEADHATAPEPILDSAWQWQERLHRAFGPSHDGRHSAE